MQSTVWLHMAHPQFEKMNFLYRPLLETLREAFEEVGTLAIHMIATSDHQRFLELNTAHVRAYLRTYVPTYIPWTPSVSGSTKIYCRNGNTI